MVFASNRDGNWEIYRMTGDEGHIQWNLSRNPADDMSPFWHGDWVHFQTDRNGDWEVYRMTGREGHIQRNLSKNAAKDMIDSRHVGSFQDS